ncbi:unnamed protein product, partial [Brachionus calyciflorus]
TSSSEGENVECINSLPDKDLINQKVIMTQTAKERPLIILGDQEGQKHCKQRLHTDLNDKPLKLTKKTHIHDSDDQVEIDNIILIAMKLYFATNTTNRTEIVIPEKFTKTYSKLDFVLYDSGKHDVDRMINLARDENISYLNSASYGALTALLT